MSTYEFCFVDLDGRLASQPSAASPSTTTPFLHVTPLTFIIIIIMYVFHFRLIRKHTEILTSFCLLQMIMIRYFFFEDLPQNLC